MRGAPDYSENLAKMTSALLTLTIQEITILVSLVFGLLALIGGILILVFIPKLRNPIELAFWGVRLNTHGGMPAVIILVGAIFVGFPTWKAYESPAKFPVSGKIQLDRGQTTSGILIGIIPGSYLTQTGPDGRFSVTIPKGNDWSYEALVYLPNSKPLLFHLGVVRFDGQGNGVFDHTLVGEKK
jgi:hypothetical protein